MFVVINYLSHRSMTQDKDQWLKGNYNNFKKKFESIKKWEYKKHDPDSLFCYDEEKTLYRIAYLHAGIIMFDDIGMVLGPIDFYKAQFLIRKKIKEIKKEMEKKEEKNTKVKIKTWDEYEAKEILDKLID
jgi:hypothetical protein